MSRDFRKEYAEVLEAWERYFPQEPPQQDTFVRSWLRHADVDCILQWIAYAADCHAVSPLRNPGAWITSRLKPKQQIN
ncbi:MAG TPA: hypothetical protein VMS18_20120 [Candidatus Binatia bacterium]|nr:hypothetical protein [Candidatus Binatia bacterium]